MAKFQNVTIGFNQLNKMSVPDRFEVASADKSVLTNLTPEQYSRLFPGYYKNILSKGVTEKSVTQATTQGAGRGGTSETPSVASGGRVSGAGRPSSSGAETGRAIAEGRVKSNALQQILKKNGIGSSDPASMTELQRNQKDVFEKLKKGSISADDASVGFMKEISTEKLKSAGIERVQISGDKFEYRMMPTKASTMSDEEIEKNLKSSGAGNFSARERATLDFISKREGSKDPNTIFGDSKTGGNGQYSKALGLDKRPLTDMSILEVLDMQKKLTRLTAANGVANGIGTSAVGSGQMIRSTLLTNLRNLGIPEKDWNTIKFDKNLQERLTLQNFKTSKIGDPNADPSTWNLYRLGGQYESLDTSKGFKPMSEHEKMLISNASSQKGITGPITPELVAKERDNIIRQEISERQSAFAKSLVPDFPQGLDQRYKADYAKLDDKQKYTLYEYIQKNGVANLNGKVSATSTSAPMENSPLTGAAKELQGDQATVRRGNIDPRLKGILDGASSAAGIEVDVFSGGQMSIAEAKKAGAVKKGNKWYLNGEPVRTGSTRHDDGLAADVRLYVRDSEGKRRQLNPQNPEDEQLYRKFVVESRKRGATGYGAGPGYMSGTDMHVDIARQGYWGTKESAEGAYPWLAPSIAQGDVELKKQRLAQAAEPKVEPKVEQAKISRTPEYLKEKVDVETVEARPSGPKVEAPPKLQAQASPENPGDIRRLPQTQVAEATPVEVKAEGGAVSVNADEIKALPIQGLKGDNAIVADKNSNPLFTMNTKQESARYDPRTSQVMVEPISQTNPDSLMNPEQTQPQSVSSTQPVEQSSRGTDLTTDIAKAQPNYTVAQGMSLTANPVHCPSFARAIAASNMMKTSDIFGGHFDWGASNLA